MKEPHSPSPLGQLLKDFREDADLSLYKLAQLSGVPRSKLLLIERGETRQPTVATLNKLAAALHIEPEDLYDAVWKDSGDPLPSLPVYFRSKYHLSDQQIAELESTVERITEEAEDAP